MQGELEFIGLPRGCHINRAIPEAAQSVVNQLAYRAAVNQI